MKYIYGASLVGLQEFIFKTNKLREIIGGSELIKQFDMLDLKEEFGISDYIVIVQAAGNLRVILKDEVDARKIVRELPKKIMERICGISISQALVEYDDNNYDSAIKELERKLKVARNQNSIPLDGHFALLDINPRTGFSALDERCQEGRVDIGSLQKLQAFDRAAKENKYLKGVNEKIGNSKNKIAIIHIDGNSLGEIVRGIRQVEEMQEFSKQIKQSTKEAFENAKEFATTKNNQIENKKIREIILGGDDVTLMCDADLAIDFVCKFLSEFENNTSFVKGFDKSKERLNACAGIAFCNEKFPFFMAVKLANELCQRAKSDSRGRDSANPPSSLMFHNIQDSFVGSFDEIRKRELIIKNDSQEIACDFGAYYLNFKPNIQTLQEVILSFRDKQSPKSRLREWLNVLKEGQTKADNELKRIVTIFKDKWIDKHAKKLENPLQEDRETNGERISKLKEGLSVEKLIVEGKTPVFDILQILAVESKE